MKGSPVRVRSSARPQRIRRCAALGGTFQRIAVKGSVSRRVLSRGKVNPSRRCVPCERNGSPAAAPSSRIPGSSEVVVLRRRGVLGVSWGSAPFRTVSVDWLVRGTVGLISSSSDGPMIERTSGAAAIRRVAARHRLRTCRWRRTRALFRAGRALRISTESIARRASSMRRGARFRQEGEVSCSAPARRPERACAARPGPRSHYCGKRGGSVRQNGAVRRWVGRRRDVCVGRWRGRSRVWASGGPADGSVGLAGQSVLPLARCEVATRDEARVSVPGLRGDVQAEAAMPVGGREQSRAVGGRGRRRRTCRLRP